MQIKGLNGEALAEKNRILSQYNMGKYVDKNNITLSEILYKTEENKLLSNTITENSYSRNICTIKKIDNLGVGNIPIQKITIHQLQALLNKLTNMAQSSIDKVYDELNLGYKEAVRHKIVADNLMCNVSKPLSIKPPKMAEPFTIEEEKKLIDYVTTHILITNENNKMDNITFKNIILLALMTGMRIGELGALNFKRDINFDKKQFLVRQTLSKNKKQKIIMGETTKTGRVSRKNQKLDFRIVPFSVVDEDIIKHILAEQIPIAENTPNNKENLLFTKIDGTYIDHSKITSNFKQMCYAGQIKSDLPSGCHIHMTKHTFVTRCIEAGMDLLTISSLVGTSVKVLQKTYAHILLEFIDQELQDLNSYYKKNNLIFKI